jgi:hypothetical protein
MRKILLLSTFVISSISSIAYAQIYEMPEIRLKAGLPSVFQVNNVRQISDREGEAELNVSITVKKGKIESVSRDGGCWIVTIRSGSNDASTYLIKDSQFRIADEESKKVIVNAIHWKDGN